MVTPEAEAPKDIFQASQTPLATEKATKEERRVMDNWFLRFCAFMGVVGIFVMGVRSAKQDMDEKRAKADAAVTHVETVQPKHGPDITTFYHDGHKFIVAKESGSHGVGIGLTHHPACECFNHAKKQVPLE